MYEILKMPLELNVDFFHEEQDWDVYHDLLKILLKEINVIF